MPTTRRQHSSIPSCRRPTTRAFVTRPTAKDQESTIRYDVEVSGFPSSHAGHISLLRLKDQDYPGSKLIEDWPAWNLPILKWARGQGALVGYAHAATA